MKDWIQLTILSEQVMFLIMMQLTQYSVNLTAKLCVGSEVN